MGAEFAFAHFCAGSAWLGTRKNVTEEQLCWWIFGSNFGAMSVAGLTRSRSLYDSAKLLRDEWERLVTDCLRHVMGYVKNMPKNAECNNCDEKYSF